MPSFTNGFKTAASRNDHFNKHGHHFSVVTEIQYEELADGFCGGKMDSNTTEFIRSNDNAVIRYNIITNEFGIVGNDGYIKTYFKPSRGHNYFLKNCI